MQTETDLRYCQHPGGYSWEEHDARGIFLCRVCEECQDAKLAQYRPDVLTDANYWHDEPID